MMFHFAFAENQIQFGSDQMLKHGTHISRSTGVGLQFFGLPEQIINICPK